MLPAVVQVKAPVGIKVIVPPVAEIGAGAVMVTIAAVPEIMVTGAVGATVAAEAIVVATAVLAIKPDTSDVALAAPKTGVTITMLVLVQAEILPLVTVPNRGVTKVGLVANTKAPLPVSSVTAVAKLADEGVAKKAATLAPSPLMPVATGNPVQLANTPLVGVPSSGVTNVGLVANTKAPEPVSPVTAAAKLADEGMAKKAATLAPSPLTPVATGSPVQLVNVPD
jgi:hypothetical protein